MLNDKTRVIEGLLDMAKDSAEGVKRVRDGARLLVLTGSDAQLLAELLRRSEARTELLSAAARFLES